MSIAGSVVEAGNLKSFVPEGYSHRTGTNTGDPDDDQLWILNNPPSFLDYYWIIHKPDENNVDMNVSATKQINNGEDITPFKAGNTMWSGIVYMYGDTPCNVLKGVSSDAFYQVTIIGHTLDSEEARTVLESIALK